MAGCAPFAPIHRCQAVRCKPRYKNSSTSTSVLGTSIASVVSWALRIIGGARKKQQTVSSPAFTPMARRRRSFAPRRRCEHIWFARSLRNCSVLLCSPGWFTSCSPFLLVASEPFADPALFGSGGPLTPLGLTRLHWRCSREASRAFACLRLFSYGAVSGRTCQVQWSRGIHERSRQVDHSPVAVRSLCRDECVGALLH